MKASGLTTATCLGLSCTVWSLRPHAAVGRNPHRKPGFQKNCAKCHGKTAKGRHFGGPSLISEKGTATSAEDLRTILTDGKGRMPKYAGKLTPEEINTLVEQIEALRKQ